MEKYFNLCIDGWIVKNNEINLAEESCNVLDLHRQVGTIDEKRILVNSSSKNGRLNFVLTYEAYGESTKMIETPTIDAMQSYFNSHLQGVSLSVDEVADDYYPLAITKGWTVCWNHFSKSTLENPVITDELGIEDIAYFEHGNYILDVSIPSNAVSHANKEILVQFAKKGDWENILQQFSSNDIVYISKRINAIFWSVSYQNHALEIED